MLFVVKDTIQQSNKIKKQLQFVLFVSVFLTVAWTLHEKVSDQYLFKSIPIFCEPITENRDVYCKHSSS